MATFVEAKHGVNNDATEIDIAISSPFATINAGDTVIVSVSWEGADDTPTVYDTASNNYTSLTKRKDPLQNQWIQMFYFRYPSGASNQYVYFGNGATSTYKNIVAARVSGMSANPYSVEDYNSANASSVALGSALSISGAGIIIGACKIWATQSSITPGPTGFTDSGAGGPLYQAMSYKTYAGSGSDAVSFTGSASTNWVMVAAAFLNDGGGGGSTIVPKSTRFTMLGIG